MKRKYQKDIGLGAVGFNIYKIFYIRLEIPGFFSYQLSISFLD